MTNKEYFQKINNLNLSKEELKKKIIQLQKKRSYYKWTITGTMHFYLYKKVIKNIINYIQREKYLKGLLKGL
jgi:hypothetical protein